MDDFVKQISDLKVSLTQPPAKSRAANAAFSVGVADFCLCFVKKSPAPAPDPESCRDVYKLVLDQGFKREDLKACVREKLDIFTRMHKDEQRNRDRSRMPQLLLPRGRGASTRFSRRSAVVGRCQGQLPVMACSRHVEFRVEGVTEASSLQTVCCMHVAAFMDGVGWALSISLK